MFHEGGGIVLGGPQCGVVEQSGRCLAESYRREFVQDDTPEGPEDFDQWVCRAVLNPGRPHFEGICRQWARWYADPESYGDRYPDRVASGTVSDPDARKTLEIDVAAFGRDDENREVLLAIGESKWQETIDMGHLRRLEHLRDLLVGRGEPGAESARLFLFSGTGFSDTVTQRAEIDPSVQLVGLDRLYTGS